MNVMPIRIEGLQSAADGWKQTHVPLVGYHNQTLEAAGAGNDSGLMYFVPAFQRMTHRPTPQATADFFSLLIVISTVLAVLGFWRLFKTLGMRLTATVAMLLLAVISYYVGDVYVANVAAIIATIPLALSLIPNGTQRQWIIFTVYAGLFLAFMESLRGFAGLAVLLFLAIVLANLKHITLAKRWTLIVIMVIAFLLPGLFLKHATAVRDNYLKTHVTNYTAPIANHPLWHNMYIGFGYLTNDYGLKYRDEIGAAKVKSVDPSIVFLSPAYEKTLEHAVFDFAKTHPLFVITTIFAKLGVAFLLIFAVFANVGIILSPIYRKPWWLETAFWVTILLSALPGIIAIPELRYTSGLATIGIVYALVSLEYARQQGLFQQLAAWWTTKKTRS